MCQRWFLGSGNTIMLVGAKEIMDRAGRAEGRDLGLAQANQETAQAVRDSMTGLWLCFSRVIFTPDEPLVLMEMSSVVRCFLWLPAKPEAAVPSQPALLSLGCCRTLPRNGSHHKTHCASPLVPVTECVHGPGRRTCCRWRAHRGGILLV